MTGSSVPSRPTLAPLAAGERSRRVDLLIVLVISVIALIVVGLMTAFSVQDRMHTRTLGTIAVSRSVRGEALAISQALADLEAARRAGRALTGDESPIEAAKADARSHLATLEQQTSVDPDLTRAAARVRDVIEQDFALDAERPTPALLERSNALRAELREATAALLAGVNTYNDIARAAERRTREVLDAMAIALGLLALAAAALAVLALRRERENWRLAHAATEDARARATASDLAKSRFLAAASHDMRQPLHALTLYLSALERRVETTEARDIIAKMERATQSMVGMFATLLDLARIQAGAISPEIADVSLQEVIDRVTAENPGRRVDAAPTTLGVRTDAVLFERVLRNLVSNALRHGGGAAHIEAVGVGDRVEISVVDSGPGNAPEDQARIFDEFVRIEAGANSEGLGLGLAIVKRICDLLGHDLTLHSAPGHGARFTIDAPRAIQVETPNTALARDDALSGAHVLVVDDDELAREAIAGALRDLGAAVRASSSQAEAEAVLAAGFQPRLIVMDLRIEGDLRGIGIADALRARVSPPPRIIVVTGETAPETLDMLRASGHVWMIKPVDPRGLCDTASAQLNAA
ncbi:MAG: ATP-binding protein [Hyphomonadaceae bacterium]